jgi:hypothetical protein
MFGGTTLSLKNRIMKLVGATDEKAFNTAVQDAHKQYASAVQRAAEHELS